MTTPVLLTPIEARVLATLMEKARTVPDSYPLTLNSLLLGCNQKTSREPLMELSESEVSSAVDTLREAGLVHETTGGRTTKFTHNAQRGIGVPEQSAVLLGLLMLRGPQTAAELRLNAERWYRFADTSSVEAFLDELQERSEEKGGPLVIKLDRAPGAREQRWAHLLCGPVDASAAVAGRMAAPASADLQARVTQLETELAELRTTVQKLCAELGMSQPGQAE
nr:YceH family protein [uncultured Rhodoferax sp.]